MPHATQEINPDRSESTMELRLSPIALGISWRFLSGRPPREKAKRLRRAAITLLEIADEMDGGRS